MSQLSCLSSLQSTAFAPFGRRWRLHRKLARVALSPEALKSYESGLMEIAAMMNRSFIESPAEFIDHVRLYVFLPSNSISHSYSSSAAGQVIMSTMYGISVQSAENPVSSLKI